MNKPFLATIKINVVAYKPTEDGKFDISTIDTDSFVSELSCKNDYECSEEIKQFITKTKEIWPKQTPTNKV